MRLLRMMRVQSERDASTSDNEDGHGECTKHENKDKDMGWEGARDEALLQTKHTYMS